ncbi:hypothetical protein EJB05_57194, partial [Eragrostis curvula]
MIQDIEATMTQSRPWSGLEDDAKDDIGSNRHGKTLTYPLQYAAAPANHGNDKLRTTGATR